MNIEDVKQINSTILNIMITAAMKGEIVDKIVADIRRVNEYPYDDYCYDIKLAREAQAKALAIDSERYIKSLCIACWEPLAIEEDIEDWELLTFEGIKDILLATPRQISEAAYITLMEVQHA